MAMKLLLDPATSVTGAAITGGTGGNANPPAATPNSPAASVPVPAAPVVAAPAAPASAKPAEVKADAPGFMAAPGAKPEEKKPAAADVPADPAKPAATEEKWALKVPEGVAIKPEHLQKFEEEMKALGMDSAKAQKILDRDLAHDARQRETYIKQADEQSVKWHGDLKSRWGDKFNDMDAQVKRVFDHGDPDGKFRAALSAMKLQYAPELMQFVERFAPLFADPRLNPPSQVGVTVQDTRTPREKLTAEYERRMKAPVS